MLDIGISLGKVGNRRVMDFSHMEVQVWGGWKYCVTYSAGCFTLMNTSMVLKGLFVRKGLEANITWKFKFVIPTPRNPNVTWKICIWKLQQWGFNGIQGARWASGFVCAIWASGCLCAMWALRLETVERCLLQIEQNVFPLCLLTWL